MIKLVDTGKNNFNVSNLGIHVKYGEEVYINSTVLYASDDSNKAEDILFHVSKKTVYGHLVFNHNDSILVTNFTIFDLANNLISYKHNESAKVTSDSFDLIVTNGVIVKNTTFNITITGVVNKIPILEVILPLYVNPFDVNTFSITPQHLLSYQPSTASKKITYILSEPTKYGMIFYDGKFSNPSNFSQEDIDNGLITYSPSQNSTFKDAFLFQVTNNNEEGYLLNGELMLRPTK